MSNTRKPGLGFSGNPARAGALAAPVAITEHHRPHRLDWFSIELDEETDTATIYLHEVVVVPGVIPITRQSMSFPLTMLADLVKQRPAKPSEGRLKAVTA